MNVRTFTFNADCILPLQVLLGLLDTLLMGAFLLIPVAWLANPLRLSWGPMHLHIAWGFKPILAPLVILAARMALARLGTAWGMSPRGLLETRGYKRLILSV